MGSAVGPQQDPPRRAAGLDQRVGLRGLLERERLRDNRLHLPALHQREDLLTEYIDWFLRKSWAGLNGTNSPVSCPIRIQRPATPRLRRIGSKSGVPTLSISTSTPRPSVNCFTSGEKSSPRAWTTTWCAPIARMRSALSGEVVCAIT